MNQTHKYNTNFSEYNKALNFIKTGCNCGCSSKVPQEKFAQLRVQFQNLPKPSQDAFVMGQLLTMNEGEITTSSRFPNKKRTNIRTFYRWNNKTSICLKTYLNSLGISRNYLKNLIHVLAHEGLSERVHGNTGRLPQWKSKKVINQKVRETVKNFILNYTEEYGLPDPGKSKIQKYSIIFLPTEMTYRSVHRNFITSLDEKDNLKSLKYEAFRRLWHELTPHIKFMKPQSDLCDTCHKFRNEMHSCSDKITKQTLKKNFFNTNKEPN